MVKKMAMSAWLWTVGCAADAAATLRHSGNHCLGAALRHHPSTGQPCTDALESRLFY
jgi:hypothetical protein